MKESRTQLLPPLFPCVGFVPAADIEETSQLWASFSMNIDLWQEKRMDFREKIPVFRVLSFPAWCCRCLHCIASQRDEVPTVVCMKMHVCHCCLRVADGKQAGKLKPECWMEGGRAALTQTWSSVSPPFPASSWEQIWYLMSQPAIQSLMLSQALFSPPTQWHCRQLLFLVFLSFVSTGIAVD